METELTVTGTQFRVLGPLEVTLDGAMVDVGPHRQRAVLALLLMNANNVVTTDRIIEELWHDDPDGKERSLWVYISRLRSVLEPHREKRGHSSVLVRHDLGYRLNVADHALDADRFVQAARHGASILKSDPEAASALLADALALWRGSAYEEFQYERFAEAEAANLGELRTVAYEDRIDADLRSGRSGDLIGEIERHLQEHPLRERPTAQLMLALYRAGRPADALGAFSRFKRFIGEELGIEPTPELAGLEEQILLHDSRLWLETRQKPEPTETTASTRNPYKGLQAFKTADAGDFYGRERLVAAAVRRINAGARLVALVGGSGSGKTSVIRAGVIPALEQGAARASNRTLIAEMVPGARPFAELEAALNRVAADPPGNLMDVLTSGPGGLLRAALRVLGEPHEEILLFVDQFEELYTLVSDPSERTHFLDAISDALSDVHGRFRVILTLRADFYERILTHADFSHILETSILNVPSMTAEQLEAAAVLPATNVGIAIEPSLLTALVMDVIGEPGSLPLFQHALRELWDRRTDDTLTIESYEESGGVRGNLARRAEEIYSGLDPDHQKAAERLFLGLVTVTDLGQRGKRRVEAPDLLALELSATTVESILTSFALHRLVSYDRDQVTNRPLVEVTHEALLSGWPRLREWIDHAEDDLRRRVRLDTAIAEWDDNGRDPDYLFSGRQLDDYANWITATPLLLTADQRSFIELATAAETSRLEAERSRKVRETDLGRRARRRFWALLAAAATLLAGGAWILADILATTPTVAVIHQGRSATDALIASGAARAEADFNVRIIEIVPPYDSLDGAITEAVSRGAKLVIIDEAYEPLVMPLAGNHPDVVFEVLERTHQGEGFALEEGAFLMGAITALEATDPVVGFVGAAQDERSERLRAGFEAGVHHVRPSVDVLAGYSAATHWPAPDQTVATRMAAAAQFALGADAVFNAAQNEGVLEAAVHEASEGRHVYSVGAFLDEYLATAPERRPHVLSSLVPAYDGIIYTMIREHLAGEDPTPDREWSIADGAMSFSTEGNELTPTFDFRTEQLLNQLASGQIVIPSVPTGDLLPVPGSDESLEAVVNYDGQRCSYSGPLGPAIGTILDIEFVNESRFPAIVALGNHPSVEISAGTDNANHGQVMILEDEMPIRCRPLDAGAGLELAAPNGPHPFVMDDDVHVVVSVTDAGCEVEQRREVTAGDLVGHLIENRSGADGGGYSWLATDNVDIQNFTPDLEDQDGLWRWRAAASATSTFFARNVGNGDWGIGCWRDGANRVHDFGAILQVSARR